MRNTKVAAKNVVIGCAAFADDGEAINNGKATKNTAVGFSTGRPCGGEGSVFLGCEAGEKEGDSQTWSKA
jgi:hypothetical protein